MRLPLTYSGNKNGAAGGSRTLNPLRAIDFTSPYYFRSLLKSNLWAGAHYNHINYNVYLGESSMLSTRLQMNLLHLI